VRFLDGIDRDAIAGLLEHGEYFWLDPDRSEHGRGRCAPALIVFREYLAVSILR